MDFPNVGRFGANNMIEIFNKKEIDELDQIYESTPQILLNLDAAKKVDYKPAFDILLSADKVYD